MSPSANDKFRSFIYLINMYTLNIMVYLEVQMLKRQQEIYFKNDKD